MYSPVSFDSAFDIDHGHALCPVHPFGSEVSRGGGVERERCRGRGMSREGGSIGTRVVGHAFYRPTVGITWYEMSASRGSQS